jgi:SAM-dependent methyltransferase
MCPSRRARPLVSRLSSARVDGVTSLRLCQASYDAHAAEYAQRLDPTLAPAVERLVELAGARRGIRLLDLATGTGAVARTAARTGASVAGVDLSPGMLAIARELAPEIDFRLADAHALPFEACEFDAVACGLAVTHFGEPDKALGEALRVLREGGRFVASAWGGGGGGTPSCGAVIEVLKRYGASETGYRLDEETWFDVQKGGEVLRRAGFAAVCAQTERFSASFANAEEALEWALSWPCGGARLAQVDPADRGALIAEARGAVAGTDLAWRFVFNFYLAQRPESAAGSR